MILRPVSSDSDGNIHGKTQPHSNSPCRILLFFLLFTATVYIHTAHAVRVHTSTAPVLEFQRRLFVVFIFVFDHITYLIKRVFILILCYLLWLVCMSSRSWKRVGILSGMLFCPCPVPYILLLLPSTDTTYIHICFCSAPDPGVELLSTTAGYCTTASIIDARLSSTKSWCKEDVPRGTYWKSTAAKCMTVTCSVFYTGLCLAATAPMQCQWQCPDTTTY